MPEEVNVPVNNSAVDLPTYKPQTHHQVRHRSRSIAESFVVFSEETGSDSYARSSYEPYFFRLMKLTRHVFHQIRQKLLYMVGTGGLLAFFIVYILPACVDIAWISIYFAERQEDVFSPDSICTNINGTMSSPYRTPRSYNLWLVQLCFSFFMLGCNFQFLLTASSQRPFLTIYMILIEFATSFLFVLSVGVISMRDIYVPTFLRIWILVEKIATLLLFLDLPFPRYTFYVFVGKVVAVFVTVLGLFEWTQNNFPSEGGEFFCMYFYDGIYWFVVTMSTVGYGDLSPINGYAKFITIVTILYFLMVVSTAIEHIQDFLRWKHIRNATRYRTRQDNILICGHFNIAMTRWAWLFFDPMSAKIKHLWGKTPTRKDPDIRWFKGIREPVATRYAFSAANDKIVLVNDTSWDSNIKGQSNRYHSYCIMKFQIQNLMPLSTEDLSLLSFVNASNIILIPSKVVTRGEGQDVSYLNDSSSAVDRQVLRSRDIQTIMTVVDVTHSILAEQKCVVVLNHQCNKMYMLDKLSFFNATLADEIKRNDFGMQRNFNTNAVLFYADSFLQAVLGGNCVVPGLSTLMSLMIIGDEITMSSTHDVSQTDYLDDTLNDFNDGPHGIEESFHCTNNELLEELMFGKPSISKNLSCKCNVAKDRRNQHMRTFAQTLETIEIRESNPFIGWDVRDLTRFVYRHHRITILGVLPNSEALRGKIAYTLDRQVTIGDVLFMLGARKAMADLMKYSCEIDGSGPDAKLKITTRTRLMNRVGMEKRAAILKSFRQHRNRREFRDHLDAARSSNETTNPQNPNGTETTEERAVDRTTPEYFQKCKIDHAKDIPSGHGGLLIFIGTAISPIDTFVNFVRNTDMLYDHSIIWMVNQEPSLLRWQSLSHQEDVYWLVGDPTNSGDLVRAGILTATHLVFYSDPHHSLEEANYEADEIALVSRRVINGLLIRHQITNLQCTFHLHFPTNAQFLGATEFNIHDEVKPVEKKRDWCLNFSWDHIKRMRLRNKVLDAMSLYWPHYFCQYFSSGQTFSMQIFYALLFSSCSDGDGSLRLTFFRNLMENARNGSVLLLSIPPCFHGEKFHKLMFAWLTNLNFVCFALFKRYSHGYSTNTRKYLQPEVVLNPDPWSTINGCDAVFVIRAEESDSVERSASI